MGAVSFAPFIAKRSVSSEAEKRSGQSGLSDKTTLLFTRVLRLLGLQNLEESEELEEPEVPAAPRFDRRVEDEVINYWTPAPRRKYPRVLVYWHPEARAWAVVWVHNPNSFTIENFYPDHETARAAGVAMAQQMRERLHRKTADPK